MRCCMTFSDFGNTIELRYPILPSAYRSKRFRRSHFKQGDFESGAFNHSATLPTA